MGDPHLRCRKGKNGVAGAGPNEGAAVQPALLQPDAGAVPDQELEPVPAPSTPRDHDYETWMNSFSVADARLSFLNNASSASLLVPTKSSCFSCPTRMQPSVSLAVFPA